MRQIGFIGYGNMGSMIINNILSLNLLKEEEIIVSNRTLNKLNDLKEKHPSITTTSYNEFLAKSCDKIFIFVETPEFKEVIEKINPFLMKDTHIIHVSAGLSFENINKLFTGKVSQIIPSIVSTSEIANLEKLSSLNEIANLDKIKKGVSLISHNQKVEKEDKIFVENIFNEFSYIKLMDENSNTIENNKNSENNYNNYIDNSKNAENRTLEMATILSSCGPAIISFIIKRLAIISGERSLLSIEESEDLIIKTLLGTSLQLNENNLDIEEIINKSATKKGITEIGLNYLSLEFDKIANNLLDKLFEKYDSVKSDLNQEYSKK
jgi:pyrroline-5-carboxylate reductase